MEWLVSFDMLELQGLSELSSVNLIIFNAIVLRFCSLYKQEKVFWNRHVCIQHYSVHSFYIMKSHLSPQSRLSGDQDKHSLFAMHLLHSQKKHKILLISCNMNRIVKIYFHRMENNETVSSRGTAVPSTHQSSPWEVPILEGRGNILTKVRNGLREES